MFTATSIMQLVEKKKISLNTRLVDVLPNDKLYKGLCVINDRDYIDSVRIFHLLNHTSGIPDYFNGSDSVEIGLHGDSTLRFTPEQLILLAKKTNMPYFVPGSGFKYSNTNYILLGMIIEKLTGLHYSQYIQRNILDPLKMNHTFFASRNPPSNRAPGYLKGKKTVMPATLAGPAGDIVSDLDDMQIFIRAWYNGSLFSEKSTMDIVKNKYYQPMVENIIKYGLGVINILDQSLGHGGQTFGFEFYAGCTKNGSSFILSIDDAAVSAWEPAIMFSGLVK
jgi:D-alanyl-D-alanine carboxypeptidase